MSFVYLEIVLIGEKKLLRAGGTLEIERHLITSAIFPILCQGTISLV